MKKELLGLGLIVTLMYACLKDDSEEKRTKELQQLEQYLTDHTITEGPTESGLYYIQLSLGESTKATENDYVVVNYTGSFVNETVFTTTIDSVARSNNMFDPTWVYGTQQLRVNSLIEGFKEGLQMMGEGGQAKLIIPSYLAYGYLGSGKIPPYTSLIFDVHLERIIKNINQYQEQAMADYVDTIDNYTVVSDGLYLVHDILGAGDSIFIYDRVKLNYTSFLIDGRKFNYGNNIIYNVGFDAALPGEMGNYPVTEGWIKGLSEIRRGGSARIVVHSDFAYSQQGLKFVSTHTPIVYQVEIIEINPE